jgi:signal peptidase I
LLRLRCSEELRRIALYALGLVIILLFSGKLMGLPIALVMVYGSSMEPSLKSFDLLVAVSPHIIGRGVKVGDIVMYCIRGTLNTACIVHRVVEVRDGVVVTKGDAVKVPDPPVRLNDIRYIVVARVPRLYIAALLVPVLVLAFRSYVWLPWRIHGLRVLAEPGVAALILVLGFIVFDVAYLGTVYIDSTPVRLSAPIIRKESLFFNLSSGVIEVTMTHDPRLHPVSAPECMVRRPIKANLSLLGEKTQGNQTIIRLRIDRSVFEELWRHNARIWGNTSLGPGRPYKVSTTLWVSCRLVFNLGVLRSTYPVSFAWREPSIALGKGRICIDNENPVSMELEISMHSWSGKAIEKVRVPPFTKQCLSIPPKYKWVYACYTFLGHRLCQGGVAG